jgi:hypothetical protein
MNHVRQLIDSGQFDEVVLIASHSWWGDHDQRTLSLLESRLDLDELSERQFTQIKVFRFHHAARITAR